MFSFIQNTGAGQAQPKRPPPEALAGREVNFDTELNKWVFADTGEIFVRPVRVHGDLPIVIYRKKEVI